MSCSATVAVIIILDWLKKSSNKNNKGQNNNNDKKTGKSNESLKNKKVRRLTKDVIPQLQWIKVGQVKELYYYPLKSGRGKEIAQCQFTEYGIAVTATDHLTLRDR